MVAKELSSSSALEPASASPRSRLDEAIKSMSDWPAEDRQIFIASFTTRKSGSQVALELGLTPSALQARRRSILRRFMHAAEAIAVA